jgi:methyl-accepting chemotaxis protein
MSIAALAAIWWTVLRPLARLTSVTERLATGDLAPVEGFARTGGEIGRMASALSVFRNGLLERQEMEAQEKIRLKEEFDAQRHAEAEKREAADLAAQEKAEREAAERTRQDEEEESRRKIERLAQEEREAIAAEQARVVGILGDALGQLASGKLATRIKDEFPGDYEALRTDFNEASRKLAEAITLVVESAESIRNEANEITSASSNLNRRTEQQAATLEETAAALDELTASVQAAASVAENAQQMVQSTQERAQRSGKVVRDTVDAMQEIADGSIKISQITNVIDEIAFQTNLLALNAGVEAARAGEAGRGFAVVASEVRALAQRSSNAAREIADLIDLSSNQVQRGVHLVDEAGTVITEIEVSVTEVKEQIVGMATRSSEQAIGIREINVAMNQLDKVTQQNAALSEETNAATQSLLSMSTALIDNTAKFDVSGVDGGGAQPKRTPERRPAPPSADTSFESRNRPMPLKVAASGGGRTAITDADGWEAF